MEKYSDFKLGCVGFFSTRKRSLCSTTPSFFFLQDFLEKKGAALKTHLGKDPPN